MKFSLIFLIFLSQTLSGQQSNKFKKKKTPTNIPEIGLRTFEHISVPIKVLKKWKSQNLKSKITRKDAQKWLKEGQAKIIHSSFLSARTSQDARQETIQELIYPTNYRPAFFGKQWPYPTNFNSMNLGNYDRVVFSSAKEKTSLDRITSTYRDQKPHTPNSPFSKKSYKIGDLLTPAFFGYNTEFSYPRHRPYQALAEIHHFFEKPNEVLLVFTRGERVTLPKIERIPKIDDITITTYFVEVSHPAWITFSSGKSLEAIKAKAMVWCRTLQHTGQAHFRLPVSCAMRLNHKGVVEDIHELIYPTAYYTHNEHWALERRSVLVGGTYDTRNVGLTMEFEPKRLATGHFSLRYSISDSSHHGDKVVHRYYNGSEWIADATMPAFSVMRLSGSTLLQPGETTLIGVSPAFTEEGKPDESRRRLLFLRAE